MAATNVTYSGNGSNRDFVVPFSYTSRTFVKAYVGGVITSAWTWLNATTIRFNTAPPSGTNNVELRRETSTNPLVDFTAAATITDSDIDLVLNQMLDVLEENQNNSLIGMQQSGGNWDATSDRLVNVAAPLASTDAANKSYVDSVIGSADDAADSAADAAASAADALAQAGAAAASATAAAGSALTAAITASSIVAVLPVSGLAVDEVPVANGATSYDAIPVRLTKRLSSGTPSAVSSFDIALPAGHDEYLLDIYNFVMSSAGADLELRFSLDSGATYLSGASDYDFVSRGEANSVTVNTSNNAASRIVVAPTLNNSVNQPNLLIKIFPGAGGIIFNTVRVDGIGQHNGQESYEIRAAGRCSNSATRATHVRILASGGTVTGNYVLYGVKR